MFTVALAFADSFGQGNFHGLYILTFILDIIALIEILPRCFNKKG